MRTTTLRALRRGASRGLTLVELVIVITIIGVLTAAISIGVVAAKKKADIGAARTACGTARSATVIWEQDHPTGECPTIDQLRQSKVLDTGFNPKDPWGNPLKLSCDADEIVCTSAGPDRKEGTEDDIRVPPADTASANK
jgi:general secretion pathway protein G